MARSRSGSRLAATVALLLLTAVAPVLLLVAPVDAHGALTVPGSRTYLCRIDGTHDTGDIVPNNPACADAIAMGGKQPLWDWFGVLRSDGAGRTRGFIPDGRLCSGGSDKYAGYDQARVDWPYTRLTAGAQMTIRYNAWAAHPGEFRLYVTRDGYDPTEPLGWDDLEDEPFSVWTETRPNGTDEQNGSPDYQWTASLPQKSGRHIIYSIWERSDSAETFYGCSDVVFDEGTGQVMNIGSGAQPVAANPSPTSGTSVSSTVPSESTSAPGSTTSSGEGADPSAMVDEDGSTASGGVMIGVPAGAAGDRPAEGGVMAIGNSAPSLPEVPGVSATVPPSDTGGESGGGGVGIGLILAFGLAGVGLGAAVTTAIQQTAKVRRLEAQAELLRHAAGVSPDPEPYRAVYSTNDEVRSGV